MSQSAESESSPEKKPPSAGVPPSSEPEGAAEESFSDLLDQFERQQEKPAFREGGVLTGTIVSARDDGVFVDIGRKSEAFLPLENRSEKDEDSELRVGDSVDISITGRSPDGYLLLSRVLAERPQNWAQFEWAFSTGAAVAGTVTEAIKGGLAVDVGVRAFMPASRSGIKDSSELEKLVGTEIRCRIIQLDVDDENVIVDRRVLLEEEKERQREEAIARLEPGAVVQGTVRNIRDFGAFLDLGGVDALLHAKDLSWDRTSDVSAVLSEGDSLEVKVLKIEDSGKRISVGRKQLTPDPWTLIGEKLKVGDRRKGEVKLLKDFGAFVALEPGVEGLVHVSEMSWARRVRHPKDLLKVGEVVDVVVLDINTADRRISLGIKQALGDPWERIREDFPVGKVVEGAVRNLTKFGAFVEIADGIEGLVHVSDLTAKRQVNHPSEVLKVDQKIQAAIVEIDPEKRRLKLSIKKLEPDGQDNFILEAKLGDTVTGRVLKVRRGEATIELGEGVKGICRWDESAEETAGDVAESARSAQDVSSLGDMLRSAWQGGAGGGSGSARPEELKRGQVRSFKITALDSKSRSINLALP